MSTVIRLESTQSQQSQPNTTDLPMWVWYVFRCITVGLTIAICALGILNPQLGLTIFWQLIVPSLPLLFFVAPTFWRNVCPMATLNQLPQVFKFTRGLTLSPNMKKTGYALGIILFLVIVPSRRILFNSNGSALAVLLVVFLAMALFNGLLFKGKSGWCSTMCPLLPVQRLYGQTPFMTVKHRHCATCVGCVKHCYDINPTTAYLSNLHDSDPEYRNYHTFFAGAFPGLILAFYLLPSPPSVSVLEMYGQFALWVAVSLGSFATLTTFAKQSVHTITALYAVVALNAYYWFSLPDLDRALQTLTGFSVPDPMLWAVRAALVMISLVWFGRTYRKEAQFLAGSKGKSQRIGSGERKARPEQPAVQEIEQPLEATASNSSATDVGVNTDIARVVIVGNGIAGITAADTVRRYHPSCKVTVIGRVERRSDSEPTTKPVYGRSVASGTTQPFDVWDTDLPITNWLSTPAIHVDTREHHVVLSTGQTVSYDKLILATGSHTAAPTIPGFGAVGTFTLDAVRDVRSLRNYVREHSSRTAVVALDDLRDLPVCAALYKLGLRVTLLAPGGRLFPHQLDARASQALRMYLQEKGINLLLRSTVAEIVGTNRVHHIKLQGGSTVPADLFFSSGERVSNVSLARTAGLEINEGVVVDDGMRTSDPSILAAGDVAEHGGHVYHLRSAATEQAQVAAINAVGGDATYVGTMPIVSVGVLDLAVTSIGRVEPKLTGEMVIIQEEAEQRWYRKLVVAQGLIVGAILVGYPHDVIPVKAAISRELDVRPLQKALQSGDWSVLRQPR